jgi:hypothetical protein
MALFTIPWPADELNFTMAVTLSDTPYLLSAQWLEAGQIEELAEVTTAVISNIEASDGSLIGASDGSLIGGTTHETNLVDTSEPSASWVLTLASSDGMVIESGMRLVAGTQYAWRGVKGNEPVGTLALATLGDTDLPAIPTVEDMQGGEVVLVYDDPTV